MMLFLVHQVACEFQRRPNVLDGEVVFPLTCSKLIPLARLPTTIATGIRVQRITGLPWQIFGSMRIRSFIVQLCTNCPYRRQVKGAGAYRRRCAGIAVSQQRAAIKLRCDREGHFG